MLITETLRKEIPGHAVEGQRQPILDGDLYLQPSYKRWQPVDECPVQGEEAERRVVRQVFSVSTSGA